MTATITVFAGEYPMDVIEEMADGSTNVTMVEPSKSMTFYISGGKHVAFRELDGSHTNARQPAVPELQTQDATNGDTT